MLLFTLTFPACPYILLQEKQSVLVKTIHTMKPPLKGCKDIDGAIMNIMKTYIRYIALLLHYLFYYQNKSSKPENNSSPDAVATV